LNSSIDQIVRCEGLEKRFEESVVSVEVLRGIDLVVNKGEAVAIVGASGSGKSTLLHLLGGLDRPTAGEVFVCGSSLASLNEREACALRNRSLGFVYQFHHLLQEFSALENVAMPLMIRGENYRTAGSKAEGLLKRVGLANRLTHKPAELSGGERQRAAVARAMVTQPDCILADEPTGNLDRRTARSLFELLIEMNQEQATSLVLATHDLEFAKTLKHTYQLVDGRLQKA
jgi:lipoprotein-releasing system ATP-binding protein|tara:strand:- start:7168 stop:7857 length:690 start_codon:yes stop_codon:yes gene_type:complete